MLYILCVVWMDVYKFPVYMDGHIYNDHPFMDLKKIVSRDFMDEWLIINVNVLIFVTFFFMYSLNETLKAFEI